MAASSSSYCCAKPSTSKNPPPTVEEIISNFKKIDIASQADDFITAIKEILERNTSRKHTQDSPSTSSSPSDNLSKWDSFIQSGGKFLKFVNDHTEKMKIDAKDSFLQSGEATKIVGNILGQIGHVHWAVAGLSIVGYLVSKCAKVSENRTECLELLQEMLTLLSHIKDLDILIKEEKEKFENAFQYIIEGSISCASQLHSGKIFRFLKSSVNSQTLSAIRSKISGLYMDLNLTATKLMLGQKTVVRPLLPQGYPSHAVGIEDQLVALNELLNMQNMEDCSSFAVVIWGLGGIGKTTLAEAIVSTVDRDRYNYARIELDLVSEKNNCKKMQQQILKDAFPSYEGGTKIDLRDNADGRAHLTEAFKCEANKPVFLFIDSALHKKGLEKILPQDLRGLPQRSRILITARIRNETDVLRERGLQRKEYPVKTLSPNHALTILCDDPAIRDGIKADLEWIVRLCNGIPLVLKIVGAHLRRMEYKADRCTQIIGALQTGREIKEEELSNRLFNFVYNKLEISTQEAFLDICCFFHENPNHPRRNIEYIVGAEEVKDLVDAALITTVMREDKEVLYAHDIIRSIGLSMSKSSRIMDINSWVEAEKNEAKLEGIKGVCLEKFVPRKLEKRHFQLMKDTLRILIWSGRPDVHAIDTVTLPELRCIITEGDIIGVESLRERPELFGQLTTLTKLKLVKCTSLKELPSTFGQLTNLKELVLSYCTSLIELPCTIDQLTTLRELDLSWCPKLKELPHTIGQLTTLGKLCLSGCKSLKELPCTIGQLTTLEELHLSKCASLKELPSTFGQLTNLKEFVLSWCTSLIELPCTIGQLTTLRELDLSWCLNLKELPPTIGQLTTLGKLCLSGYTSLKELPCTIDQLATLTKLDLAMCEGLIELPCTIGQLTTLEELYLSGCTSLKELPYTISQLITLTKLDLRCTGLKKLPSTFNNLKSLEYIKLSDSMESYICQEDGNIKIVEKREHSCISCYKDKKLKIKYL